MSGSDFASCWSKLGRAEEHFNSLKSELQAWKDTSPYSVRRNPNADGSRHSLIFIGDSTKNLERWSLICGDCVHNIRSALDHLVYTLAIQHSGRNPPPNDKTLQFPICGSRRDFDAKGHWIAPVSDAAKEFIERVQPYNRLNSVNPSLLSVLAAFDNADKHRLLNVTLVLPSSVEIKFKTISGVKIQTGMCPFVKDGAEIAYLTADPPQLNVDYSFEVALDAAVSHAPIGPHEASVSQLLTVLRVMITQVSGIVSEGVSIT